MAAQKKAEVAINPADRDKLQILQEQADNLALILRPALALLEKMQFGIQQMREKK